MSDQVAPDVKARRNRILRDLGARKFLAFKRQFLGRTLPVVVLEERDRQTGLLQGVSDNYLGILFQGPDVLKGRLLDVRVERLDPGGMLLGRLPDARPIPPSLNRQRVPLFIRG